jgi:Flp pilus assembly protein TadG
VRHRRRARRGSLLLETGLALTALVILAVGTLDFARGLAALHTVAHASTEGARYASVRGARSASPITPAGIEAFVRQRLPGIPPGDVTVTTAWQPDNRPGSVVAVGVTYTFRPVLPALWPVPISIARTARLEISH